MTMTITDTIRRKLREWLLTDEERNAPVRVQAVEADVSELEDDWGAIKQALESADVWGEDLELDSVDILVVAGREAIVRDARFGDGLYVGGRNNHIQGAMLYERDGE